MFLKGRPDFSIINIGMLIPLLTGVFRRQRLRQSTDGLDYPAACDKEVLKRSLNLKIENKIIPHQAGRLRLD